jgi:hypothetical protein
MGKSKTSGKCRICGESHIDDGYDYLMTYEDEGPTEGDIVTEDHSRFYQDGKLAFVVDLDASHTEMSVQIGRYMKKTSYWPNVWFLSDHGNYHLIALG